MIFGLPLKPGCYAPSLKPAEASNDSSTKKCLKTKETSSHLKKAHKPIPNLFLFLISFSWGFIYAIIPPKEPLHPAGTPFWSTVIPLPQGQGNMRASGLLPSPGVKQGTHSQRESVGIWRQQGQKFLFVCSQELADAFQPGKENGIINNNKN